MCGVLGLYALRESNSPSISESLFRFIEQRGPDNLDLGPATLAILKLISTTKVVYH